MGIETDNFSAVVNPEHIPPLVPDLSFEVRFMSDSVRAKAEPNRCPSCGKVPDKESSMYCPGHSLEMLTNYLATRADSRLNQGRNRLAAAVSQQPIIPHAA